MTDLTSFTLFLNLTPELRSLIWEATLPPQRIFQVRNLEMIKYESPTKQTSRLKFHIRFPHPVALSVNRESRATAQRRGFFLGAKPDGKCQVGGVWFNPQKDVLYIDRNQRMVMRHEQKGRRTIADLDRVLHVGLEWRAIMLDTSGLEKGETMRRLWRSTIQSLFAQMPQVQTITYVLPMVRHKGYHCWAREPHGASKFVPQLVNLPDSTAIPWGDLHGDKAPRAAGPGLEADSFRTSSGRTGYSMPWERVRKGILLAMEAEGDEWDGFDVKNGRRERWMRPKVVGSWLVRPDAVFTDAESAITQTESWA